jgi:hypothetical protein
MTVKELIDRLSKCNPDQRVILDYVDNTDWVYRMEFGEDEIIDDFEMVIATVIKQKKRLGRLLPVNLSMLSITIK